MKLQHKRSRQDNRSGKSTSVKSQPEPSQESARIAKDWMLWWVAAFTLMLVSNPRRLGDRIPIFPALENSLLAPDPVWNAPLAGFGESWPYPFFSAVASCMVATLSQRCIQVSHAWVIVVSVVGICSLGASTSLSAAIVTLAAVALIDRFGKTRLNSRKTATGFIIAAIGVGAAGVASTLEFGITLFLLTLGLLECSLFPKQTVAPPFQKDVDRPVHEPRRYRWFVICGWLVALAIPGLLYSGYWNALLRPVSWLWLQPPLELLPSTAPIWASNDMGIWHLAALTLVADRWWSEFRGNPGGIGSVSALGILTVITLGCSRYFWLGVIVIGLARPLPVSGREITRPACGQAPRICAAIALLFMVIQLGLHGGTIVSVDLVTKAVDPGAWNVSGNVLLTNLDQSADWQSSGLRKKFKLIVSDRWDIYARDYPQYSRICEDWKHCRREAYSRGDGTWAGYQDAFVKWNPTLVVVDSDDVQTIRQVALDSNWKPLGIDQARIIFGDARDSMVRGQADQAGRLFSFLEMPRSETQLEFENTLPVGDSEGSWQIANVLTALRLPYAALRVLDDQDSKHHRIARAYAFIEIAHRTQRYTGQSSLVDLVRAWTTAEQLQSSWRSTSSDRLQIQQALAALQHRDVISGVTIPADSRQQRIRTATATGEIVVARKLAQGISHRQTREFFLAALGSSISAAERLELLTSLDASALDEPLRSELNFYIGCAAMEISDMSTAKAALERVARDTHSPFNSLAKLYVVMSGT